MKIRLVEDARHAWKWASVNAAWLFGSFAAFVAAYPDAIQHALSALPVEVRTVIPAWAFLLGSGIPIALRVLTFKPKEADHGED